MTVFGSNQLKTEDYMKMGLTMGLSKFNVAGISGVQAAAFMNCVWDASDSRNSEVGRTDATYGAIATAGTIGLGILKFFGGFGVKEKAKKDITESAEVISTSAEIETKIKDVHRAKLKEILTEINKQVKIIEEAITAITELTNAEMKEEEDKLQEQKDLITSNIEILNDSEKSKEEKDAALESINGAKEAITTLGNNVLEKLATITEQTSKVANAEGEIITQVGFAENEIQTALNEVKDNTVKVTKENLKNVKYEVEGSTEEAQGTAYEAAAASLTGVSTFTMGVTAGKAIELQKKAVEYLTAGAEHIGGAATNMTALSTELGKMGKDYAEIASDVQIVGSVLTKSQALIVQYGAAATGAITSIGSWNNLDNGKLELDGSVELYKKDMEKAIEDATSTITAQYPNLNNQDTNQEYASEIYKEETSTQDSNRNDEIEKAKNDAIQKAIKNIKFNFDINEYSLKGCEEA